MTSFPTIIRKHFFVNHGTSLDCKTVVGLMLHLNCYYCTPAFAGSVVLHFMQQLTYYTFPVLAVASGKLACMFCSYYLTAQYLFGAQLNTHSDITTKFQLKAAFPLGRRTKHTHT